MGVTTGKQIKRSPALPDEIARLLREQIKRGTLGPGDRLPTEQQIGQTYGVSRAVVREAISRQKYDGLLESFQGRGIYDSEQGAHSTFRLEQPDLTDQQELAHILELLIAVEVAATALAAQRRNQRQLAAIEKALQEMAQAIERGESGVDEDLRFHTEIVNATGNPFFTGLTGFLENRVRTLIRTARRNTARFEGLAHKVQAEHTAIFNAIAGGDVEAARDAAERHLRNAAARLQLYRNDLAAEERGEIPG